MHIPFENPDEAYNYVMNRLHREFSYIPAGVRDQEAYTVLSTGMRDEALWKFRPNDDQTADLSDDEIDEVVDRAWEFFKHACEEKPEKRWKYVSALFSNCLDDALVTLAKERA